MKTSSETDHTNPFFQSEVRRRELRATTIPSSAVIKTFLNSNPNPDPTAGKNLAALQTQEVAFVVTGQQIGLFTGPLLTLSKAVTAVRLAAELEREQGKKVIPVFWMQTEDHDFFEISSTTFLLHGRKFAKISLPAPASGLGDSVGKMALEGSTLELLRREVAALPLSSERGERILSAYTGTYTLAEAFRFLLADYLRGSGILFFDPMSTSLSVYKGAFLARAFYEWEGIERCLFQRDEELLRVGSERQVKLRNETPLVALSLKGKRGRLTKRQGEWIHPAGVLLEGRIRELFDQHPELWTSSALLRPIMQQHFFPASVLVLGPAERRYFEQLRPLYQLFSLHEPLVMERHHFSIVPESIESRLEESGLMLESIESPVAEYLEELERKSAAPSLAGLEDLRTSIREAWARSAAYFQASQLPLDSAISRTEKSLERNVDRFERKFRRALELKYNQITQLHRKLNEILMPMEEPLERSINAASFDVDSLVQSMLESVDPFSPLHSHRLRHVKE